MKHKRKQEEVRKEQLISLMEQLQQEKRFKPQDRNLKYGFYDRVFDGVVEVDKVGKDSLHVIKENGRPLGVLMANSEIVKYVKKGDRLGAKLGHRFGQWHLMHIQLIGSVLGIQRNGDALVHLSISRVTPPLEADGQVSI